MCNVFPIQSLENPKPYTPELGLRMSSADVVKILPYLEFGKMCIMGLRGASELGSGFTGGGASVSLKG